MKTIFISALIFSFTLPALADEAKKSALDAAVPVATGAGLGGLGLYSTVKDAKAIRAHKKNIEFQKSLYGKDANAELAKLIEEENSFREKELKPARDHFAAFEKMDREMWSKHHEPSLNKFAFAEEFERLRNAEYAVSKKWSKEFPEKSEKIHFLRTLVGKPSIGHSETEIAFRKLSMRLKIGFMGLGAAATGAYLLGNSGTASVIESQNFVGKHGAVPENGREEKAELIAPAE